MMAKEMASQQGKRCHCLQVEDEGALIADATTRVGDEGARAADEDDAVRTKKGRWKRGTMTEMRDTGRRGDTDKS